MMAYCKSQFNTFPILLYFPKQILTRKRNSQNSYFGEFTFSVGDVIIENKYFQIIDWDLITCYSFIESSVSFIEIFYIGIVQYQHKLLAYVPGARFQ